MSVEKNKTLVRHLMAELDRRNLEGVVAASASACQYHGFAPETLDGNGYKQMMSGLLAAFPDSRFPSDDVIAHDNKVAVRHHMQGTHRAEFQGIAPTGKYVTVAAIAIFEVVEGQVSQVWLSADFMGLMQQLGVIPQPT